MHFPETHTHTNTPLRYAVVQSRTLLLQSVKWGDRAIPANWARKEPLKVEALSFLAARSAQDILTSEVVCQRLAPLPGDVPASAHPSPWIGKRKRGMEQNRKREGEWQARVSGDALAHPPPPLSHTASVPLFDFQSSSGRMEGAPPC